MRESGHLSGPALILVHAEREIESVPSVFGVLPLRPDITRPKVPSGFGPMLEVLGERGRE